MTPIKGKDMKKKQLIWLRNYTQADYKKAYQYTGFVVKEGHLICRLKNCAQEFIQEEETVYTL